MPHVDLEARRAYHKAYRERNRERLAAQGRAYRQADPEALAAKKRADYEANKEAYKARAKTSQERRAEAIRAQRASPEYKAQRNEMRRALYAMDAVKRAAMLQQSAKAWAKHAADWNARRRQRNAAKPYWLKRYERALIKAYVAGSVIGDRTALRSFYQQVFTQSAAVCDYCQRAFPISQIVADHKTPYAKGGLHIVSNLAISCVNCNNHKHTTDHDRWLSKIRSPKIWQ